jgi:hypothetical protein
MSGGSSRGCGRGIPAPDAMPRSSAPRHPPRSAPPLEGPAPVGALLPENVGHAFARAVSVGGGEPTVRLGTAAAGGEPVVRTPRWRRVG